MALLLLRSRRCYASSSLSSQPWYNCKPRFLSTRSFLFCPKRDCSHTIRRTPLLEVRDLKAVIAESNQEVLKGVNLVVEPGEIRAIAGDDFARSAFLKVLLGDPHYKVTGGRILFKGNNLLHLNPEERSSLGGFISFRASAAEEGPRIAHFGRANQSLTDFCNSARQAELRGLTGGDEKPNEMLEFAVLGGELGILDKVDPRLMCDDMDAVMLAMNKLLAPTKYYGLMITHKFQLLDFLPSLFSTHGYHTMEDGKIAKPPPPDLDDDFFRC